VAIKKFKGLSRRWALLAQACNPSYLETEIREDYGLRPAQANSLRTPYPK
jgi:hypothetical protein